MANNKGQDYFGLQEPARNQALAVGLSSVIVCERRPETYPRKTIVIRNISAAAADIITLNFGMTTATANTGVRLGQNESISFSATSGDLDSIKREVWQGDITAICATANGNLAIFEW